jgi:hypothetical protein
MCLAKERSLYGEDPTHQLQTLIELSPERSQS